MTSTTSSILKNCWENWEEAITTYRRAIEINPNYYWSYNSLGDVLEITGKSDQAIT
ncbi:MAG: tetratricopeptide repeat protein, partial [Okeania sp. SIO2G4]|uniref:tetratricopeptide repeat protein n=1 Tax=Okeania sp. SIO2G4 TaxID=2607793 RepID=UPI0013C670D6